MASIVRMPGGVPQPVKWPAVKSKSARQDGPWRALLPSKTRVYTSFRLLTRDWQGVASKVPGVVCRGIGATRQGSRCGDIERTEELEGQVLDGIGEVDQATVVGVRSVLSRGV